MRPAAGVGLGRIVTAVAVSLLGVFLMVAALFGTNGSVIEAVLLILCLICFAGAWDVLRGH